MRWRLVAMIAVGFLIGGSAAVLWRGATGSLQPGTQVLSTGKALVGGPFALIDHSGGKVTDETYRGSYLLVFFGFTSCPDVCPSGLQVMTEALERLGEKANRIVPLFISVDPERDTPEQLAAYVSSFHPRLVGLTGSKEQIAAAAKAYRVYYAKVPDSNGGYTIDHSAIFYLMGPDGEFIKHFAHSSSVDKLATVLAETIR